MAYFLPIRPVEKPRFSRMDSKRGYLRLNYERILWLTLTAFLVFFALFSSRFTSNALSAAKEYSDPDRTARARDYLRMTLQAPVHAEDNHRRIEGEADLAYFIQVSESSIAMLPRLLRSIHHPLNIYAVHFDTKIDDKKVSQVLKQLNLADENGNPRGGQYSNVYFLDREAVTYRGISMVLNILNAMDMLRKKSVRPWDFWINISGSDYPLLSPRDQRRLLGSKSTKGSLRNFVGLMPENLWEKHRQWRYGRFFVDTGLALKQGVARDAELVDTKMVQPLAADFGGYDFISAGAWMVLHRSAVDMLLSSPLARQMLTLFSFAAEPEEHYFATVLWNHPEFNQTMVHHSLRHVVWFRNGDVTRKSGQHPFYLDEVDRAGNFSFLSTIVRSAGVLFARKFRVPNGPLMDKIDREISGIAPNADRKKTDLYRFNAKRRFRCFVERQTDMEPCLTVPHLRSLPQDFSAKDLP